MASLLDRLSAALTGRYTVERELGRGGMATVFLARDLKHSRPVALKVLHPQLAAILGPDRFLREIEIAARLNHPHILPLLDSGVIDDPEGRPGGSSLPYYVMPYVEGESLRDRLEREKQLPLIDALQITRQVASALAYAHEHGVIHRDIKPENILLSGDQAVVADFGIARAIGAAGGEKLTETGLAIGTAAYMSPEQATGSTELDARSDLYALGCVLYEMLAGEPPYAGPTAQAILAKRFSEPVPHLSTVRDVPPAVEQAITKALARTPADRFATAAEFATALSQPASSPSPFREKGTGGEVGAGREANRRRWLIPVAILALIGLVAAAWAFLRTRSRPELDPTLVAVAPFDVLDQPLALWHEGLVDVLSANLDGAGPLRTVSPTVVIQRWSGRADPASALELGQRTGAGLALFGRLTTSGGDSVRVTATLFDVRRHSVLAEIERRDLAGRVDRLADSLTVEVLRELGRTRPIGAVRLASLGSTSLPALKAFLQGEQFLRRTNWDSALVYYERAIADDSTFAPALRRASLALGWIRGGDDSLSNAYAIRAGRFTHGLSRRDSLLTVSDSLFASLLKAGPMAVQADSGWWSRTHRLFAVLEVATRSYPDDPEGWYLLGEAREHVGPMVGISAARVLDAFDRAIALDSSFGPSYVHPIEIAAREGPDAMQRYLVPYLAQNPNAVNTEGMRLVSRLLDPGAARSGDIQQALDSAQTEALTTALPALMRRPDSAESAVLVARALAARRSPSSSDSVDRWNDLNLALMLRGHLHGLSRDLERRPGLVSELALFGAVPAESAATHFRRILDGPEIRLVAFALPWWLARGDTASLAAARKRSEAIAKSDHDPAKRQRARYVNAAALGYLALAHRDTTAALKSFLALPDSLCPGCYLPGITRVQLLMTLGRYQEAAHLLESELPRFSSAPALMDVFWELLRGRVAEQLGDRNNAIREYQYVLDVWRHADPELTPYVTEARVGLQRLTGEPKR